ncbi:MAG: transposase, partial [Synergistales bacterium]|nr:transposase [Synergistales bacterium]
MSRLPRSNVTQQRGSTTGWSLNTIFKGQVDWGEATVRIGGENRKVFLFCMRLRYSGAPYVRAFPNVKQESFLAGHRYGFEFFGGIPKECLYDNLSSAVSKVLKGPKR